MLDHLDAVAAAPEHHVVLLENESIRVLRTVIRPGEETHLHTHIWGGWLYVVSWSDCVRYDADRNVMFDSRLHPDKRQPGDAIWAAPLPLHSLQNVGCEDIHVITTEIKGPG